MIKATELRIGNWVEVENYKNIQLENVHPEGTTHGDDQYLISMLKPIPLTEEILLKCGFEVCYRSEFTLRLDHKLNYKFGAGWNLVNGHFSVRYIGQNFTHIKYLHQLQNLFYALTDKELQVEL